MNPNETLYQQLILDHNRSPRNYGKINQPSHYSEGYNALCGDHYWIFIQINSQTHVVEKIKFSGEGCAISKASASMMSELCWKKTDSEIKKLFQLFKKLVQGEKISEQEKIKLNKLIIFSNIHKYPSRVKCAILAWYTTIAALENKKQTNSENIET